MTEPKRMAEIAVEYQATAADLQTPVVLQHNGHDAVVILSIEEYRRLRALEVTAEQRKRVAWKRMDALLQDVHSRPTELLPEEIESEITKARQEVSELRRAHRSGD